VMEHLIKTIIITGGITDDWRVSEFSEKRLAPNEIKLK